MFKLWTEAASLMNTGKCVYPSGLVFVCARLQELSPQCKVSCQKVRQCRFWEMQLTDVVSSSSPQGWGSSSPEGKTQPQPPCPRAGQPPLGVPNLPPRRSWQAKAETHVSNAESHKLILPVGSLESGSASPKLFYMSRAGTQNGPVCRM